MKNISEAADQPEDLFDCGGQVFPRFLPIPAVNASTVPSLPSGIIF